MNVMKIIMTIVNLCIWKVSYLKCIQKGWKNWNITSTHTGSTEKPGRTTKVVMKLYVAIFHLSMRYLCPSVSIWGWYPLRAILHFIEPKKLFDILESGIYTQKIWKKVLTKNKAPIPYYLEHNIIRFYTVVLRKYYFWNKNNNSPNFHHPTNNKKNKQQKTFIRQRL